MDAIFHEKQEGSLCAQHCLNGLLQGQYFSPVDLAQIAQSLDEKERSFMAEGGLHSVEYQQFLEQPSTNFDDSGFFSIQVIQEALSVWGLDLVPYNSQDGIAIQARREPIHEQAYICNFKQHWFSVRKLGHQWFNLNSLLTGPELISDTYLSLFLTQLQQEGYAIYIIVGKLPNSEADQLLKMIPAVQPIKPTLINEAAETSDQSGDGDMELQRAIEESRRLVENDDTMLQKALKMSMSGYIVDDEVSVGPRLLSEQPGTSTAGAPNPTQEELRQKRLAFLSKVDNTPSTPNQSESTPPAKEDELSEEDMLKRAMEMSMQQGEQA
ncbi:ataxin-3-like [Haliotis rubra]|uniref:ataxin-3-like n=1 Tax=Haliotis rubra TaxID=36100 RepID=UPI001EE559D2|nr:ataxin-3-like [Haliotis rubra]